MMMSSQTERPAYTVSTTERECVIEQVHDLGDSDTAARVREYVDSAHGHTPQETDILWALRTDEELAVEIHDNIGRVFVTAAIDDAGVVRYLTWTHSRLGAKTGGAEYIRSVEYKRDITDTVEGRRPTFRLQDETPLADVEAPDEWSREEAQRRSMRR